MAVKGPNKPCYQFQLRESFQNLLVYAGLHHINWGKTPACTHWVKLKVEGFSASGFQVWRFKIIVSISLCQLSWKTTGIMLARLGSTAQPPHTLNPTSIHRCVQQWAGDQEKFWIPFYKPINGFLSTGTATLAVTEAYRHISSLPNG